MPELEKIHFFEPADSIGYIEQMGTGIMRMKNAAKEAKISEPEFQLSGFSKLRSRATLSNRMFQATLKRLQAILKRH